MTNEEEDRLLTTLRAAAAAVPEMPDHLLDAARALYAHHLPGAGLADPDERPAPVPAGLRAESGTIRRRFSGGGLFIEIELTCRNGRVDIAGQVTPHPGPSAWVEIRTLELSVRRGLTQTGQFAATELVPGWLSVVCHRPGHPPVATRWLQARP